MSRTVEGKIRANEVQPSSVYPGSRNYAPLQREGLIPDGDDDA